MSIFASATLASIVRAGGFQRQMVADLIVDGERKLQDYPLAQCELKSNGNAKIRTQGSATFVYSDEIGRTIVPEDITSWMVPYATYLNIYYRVRIGTFDEKVLQGSFKVVKVSDPRESQVTNGGRLITIGSSVGLTLADAFSVTDRERFPAPSSPMNLTSAWAEIARLTGLPVTKNVADAAIPRSVTYQESRLDAVFDLAALLDGIPYVNNLGQVAIQPNVWGAEQDPLTIGESGQIVELRPSDLTDDGIYNQVVVRSHDDSQVGILATAEVGSGPLRYGGPFGRVPYFASSQFVNTIPEAQAYADSLLPTVSSVPASSFLITCIPDPRREVGDVVPFEYRGNPMVGRIQERSIGTTGPMTLKLLVES